MKKIFNRKGVFAKSLSVWSAFAALATTTAPAFAAGTAVLGGDAVLTGHTRASLGPDATATYAQFVADQGATTAVLDWSKFNVGAGKRMDFSGAGTTFFNLVDGAAGRSQIDGIISSGSGNVWVINPAGIAFGAGSTVDVGGLFAAAAGTLSNADALRNGTATMPSFSSFEGKVDVQGSTFAADRVAFLGKTIAADGDFEGVKSLAIGASAKVMSVDDVAGGKVEVDLADFSYDADAVVTFGDLELGTGTLDVKTSGNIQNGASGSSVKAGDARFSAGGDVRMTARANDFSGEVSAEGSSIVVVDANGIKISNMTARDGLLDVYTDSGDIEVVNGATVSATGGDVDLLSAISADATGNIVVNGTVDARTDGAYLYAGYGVDGEEANGDVQVNGSVLAKTQAQLYGFSGAVSVAEGAEVKVTEGKAILNATTTASIDGDVVASAKVQISTGNGDLDIGKNGCVKVTGDNAQVSLISGNEMFSECDINVRGTVAAVGENSGIWLASGYYGFAKGNVLIDGSVKAEGNGGVVAIDGGYGLGYGSEMYAGGGVTIKGDVSANSQVDAISYDQEVVLGAGANVKSGGNVRLLGAIGGDGTAITPVEHGRVSIQAGGSVVVKDVSVIADEADIHAAGDVRGTGTLDALDTRLSVRSDSGDIRFMSTDGAKVMAGNVSLAAANGNVVMNNSANKIGGISEITVSEGGSAAVRAENVFNLSGTYEDPIFGPYGPFLTDKTILIDDDLTAPALIWLQSLAGLYVMKGCTVKATGEGSLVSLEATSNVGISGNVSAGSVAATSIEGDVHIGPTAVLTASDTDIDYGSISMVSKDGKIVVDKGATIAATDPNAQVYLGTLTEDLTKGGIVMNGKIDACTADHSGVGSVSLKTEKGDIDVNGDVRADGSVAAMVGSIEYAADENGNRIEIARTGEGDIRVNGSVSTMGNPEVSMTMVETVNRGDVEVTEEGKIASTGLAVVSAADSVSVSGTVEGDLTALVTSKNGGITMNGKVASDGHGGAAFLQSGKDIRFTEKGVVRGSEGVDLIAQGDLIQEDAHLPYRDGRLEAVDLRPAASGKAVELTTGGDIGQGKSNPFVVDGKVYAVSLGDISLAAGLGHSLEGGDASSKVSVEDSVRFARELAQKRLSGTLTLEDVLARMENQSDFDDNPLLYSEGNMSLYTAGRMEANSFVGAGGDLTVSAARFGDMSYLNAGGKLTINNVGAGKTPQIAYFESINGKEPRINNQPNDMVIFVDGRLAGGNLNILNKFGADEAFMVETPELKSTQGIFGNPPFLHSDLDVANPMEVSAIDYLIQEVPRLTLSSDFPDEVDQNIEASGLSQKDVYWFGQKDADEKNPGEEPKKDTVEGEEDADKPAAKTVAMVR